MAKVANPPRVKTERSDAERPDYPETPTIATECREQRSQIPGVARLRRLIDFTKIDQCRGAARGHDTGDFQERGANIRVMQHAIAKDEVNAARAQWKPLSVCGDEPRILRGPMSQRGHVDIDADDPIEATRQLSRQGAGAAPEVQCRASLIREEVANSACDQRCPGLFPIGQPVTHESTGRRQTTDNLRTSQARALQYQTPGQPYDHVRRFAQRARCSAPGHPGEQREADPVQSWR